ncbi:uncharacterized protein N7498_009198 [Penicillium cinerascens]|uniref:Uncharacterized protein n=1 Tax=Penicillium cinerascens TaxID=70096 RepID=A0A9W9J3Z7_9EURO|nr:uncharacterized protein N7498_009198 [Penicillium cinerascens]KAJ5190213.1 hypothetical protein N7498_009198 [Penicillium cinerascens]
MPKKGGKKKNKGGAKPAAAAAVDKVADTAKTVVHPGHETEDKVMYGEGKTESPEQTQAPAESTTEETPAAPAVTETKEAEKETEKAAPVTAANKEHVHETGDNAQASKAGTVGELAGGDKENKAVLPENTVNATSLGAETYPSTTEASAEESAISTAATTGGAATTSLSERPKTSETTAPAAVPSETDAAHIKRPYEKPIFSNDEVKPHKMAKTEEEQAAASAAADKKALAGAGPASTAAYTTPEPVLAVEAPKKAEEKVATEAAAPKTTTADSKPADIKPIESKPVESKTAESKAPASPVAVAAASAAINNSKTDKAAAESTEPKKPEAALKRGEEPQTRPEVPKKDTLAKDTPAAVSAQQEPAKADEAQTSETAEQPEKKKGGFFGWLKRKFK